MRLRSRCCRCCWVTLCRHGELPAVFVTRSVSELRKTYYSLNSTAYALSVRVREFWEFSNRRRRQRRSQLAIKLFAYYAILIDREAALTTTRTLTRAGNFRVRARARERERKCETQKHVGDFFRSNSFVRSKSRVCRIGAKSKVIGLYAKYQIEVTHSHLSARWLRFLSHFFPWSIKFRLPEFTEDKMGDRNGDRANSLLDRSSLTAAKEVNRLLCASLRRSIALAISLLPEKR